MEKEPVYCPYCGHEMDLFQGDENEWWYTCNWDSCHAFAPSGTTPDEACQKAQQRFKPTQKPMTLEEVMKLKIPCPVWKEYNAKYFEYPIFPTILDYVTIHDLDFYGEEYRYWLEMPCADERDAAPWKEQKDDE